MTGKRRNALAAIFGLLAIASQSHAAQTMPAKCLSADEASGVVMFVLPSMLTALEGRCRAALPPKSALSTTGLSMAVRIKPESDRAWPVAKAAFGKMSDSQLPAFLGDDVLRPLMEAAAVASLTGSLKLDSCPMVDRFVNILSPLPATNLAGLVTLLIEIGGKQDHARQTAGISPFAICTATDRG